MSHEISSLMYIGNTPWHGLGTYCGDEDIDSKTAIIKAGLDWNVTKEKLYTVQNGNSVEVKTHKAIVRDFDGAHLGVVGNVYEPVQNADAFEFMDSLVDEGQMKYHTAGALRGGQRVWLLGKIGSHEVVPDDKVDQFLFLYNTHDASSSLRVLFTPVRVVCANTATWALKQGKGQGICIKHTKSLKDRIQEAKEVLQLGRKVFDNYTDFTKTAVQIPIGPTQFNTILNNTIPLPEINADEDVKNRMLTLRRNIRDDITDLFYNGTGQDIPGVAGTGWAAYNAFTEYLNYHKQARGENKISNRLESMLFGSSAALLQRATNSIMSLAA